jgi:ABC-type microcin C transport system permease subunit YejE
MSWLRRPVTVPAGLLLGEQLFVLAMIAVRLRNLLQWLALLVLVATFIVELVDVARARHRRHRGV